MSERTYVAAIDQGTTSTRCILFDRHGIPAFSHQLEHQQMYPRPGWVEHDPLEIWDRTMDVVREVMKQADCTAAQISAVGITNQRETVVAWDPETGKPYCNAVVWQDLRGTEFIDSLIEEGGIDLLRGQTGLPLSPYFAGSKIHWMVENLPEVKQAVADHRVYFGTIDSWLIWNLTGGVNGGAFVTDVTNASRCLMMDIRKLTWDASLAELFHIEVENLPEIRASLNDCYGYTLAEGPFGGEIPICGILGDQQAALFGQACFREGQGKNTYGTGCFLLVNTGNRLPVSDHGLLTTVAYQRKGDKPVYALEGAIAVAGSLVQWMRDSIKLVDSAPAIDRLAESVPDNGGVYFVPAFSGLFAPYWESSARGLIAGLTGYVNSGHLARAVLEATAYQAKDIFDAMENDSGVPIQELRVDGGMSKSDVLMQFQADMLQVPVIRPQISETTALGAAYAAGLSTGFWKDLDDLAGHWKEDHRWKPEMGLEQRDRHLHQWRKAVERSKHWSEE